MAGPVLVAVGDDSNASTMTVNVSYISHPWLVFVLLLSLGSRIPAQSAEPVLRFFQRHGSNTATMVDSTGAVVHSWPTQTVIGQGIQMLDDGTLLRNTDVRPNNSVERLAFDGTVLWNYFPPSHLVIHHDIEPMPNGNVLMIVGEDKTATQAIASGRVPSTVPNGLFNIDSLIEVRPTGPNAGTIVWQWNVWDHLIQDYNATRANFGVVGQHPELIDINYPSSLINGKEFTHLNGIDYDPIHDWVVISAPKQSEIWIIDHSTTTAEAAGHSGGRWGKGGDLLYRWGNAQAYRAGTGERSQHLGVSARPPVHSPRGIPARATSRCSTTSTSAGRARRSSSWCCR